MKTITRQELGDELCRLAHKLPDATDATDRDGILVRAVFGLAGVVLPNRPITHSSVIADLRRQGVELTGEAIRLARYVQVHASYEAASWADAVRRAERAASEPAEACD